MKNDTMLKIEGVRNVLVSEIAQAITRAQNELPDGAVIDCIDVRMIECAIYRDIANGAPSKTALGAISVIIRV